MSLKTVFTPFFLLIFSAMLASTLTDQMISRKIESLVASRDGLGSAIWFWGAASLVSAILFPIITAMLCSFNIVKSDLDAADFLQNFWELSTIENLRAWGKSFLWSFVFLLPGVWKFIMYTAVPYVVFFSKKYHDGKIDALEYSTRICKQNWKAVNWWLTVFYLIVPVILYAVGENYRLIIEHPIAGTAQVFVRTLAEYFFHYKMLQIIVEFFKANESVSTP